MAIIKIARLWPGAERAAAAAAPAIMSPDVSPKNVVSVVDVGVDNLDAFQSETSAAPGPAAVAARPVAVVSEDRRLVAAPAPAPARAPRVRRDWTWLWYGLRWVSVVVLSAGAAVSGAWAYQRQQGQPSTGTLTIQTSPAGLPVGINGQPSGVTPLTVTLPAASYSVEVGSGRQRRDLTVSVTAGSLVLQHLELSADPAPVTITTGALRVQTDPAGQTVSIDGVERGASPLTIDALAAGDHSVSVRGTSGTVRKKVTIKAGETVSLVVSPIAPSVAAPGWLSVQSSARLELREAGKLIGTTETEQLMLPAGEHTIELVNDTIGYRAQRTIDVAPGKTTVVPIDLPFGAVSLNALPWAEVWINGERVGETPIANLARRVGSYEVVFRHPEFGEKRETITVTLRQTARIGVDMRGKQP